MEPINEIMKKPLIILTGPTAVGKTKLSIQLAKAVNGEIISADSMQIYKGMNIGTAKITSSEMQGIPHYLVNEFYPDEEFNVVKFKEYANHYMEQIYERGKIPIIVGGTGFYIQAVLYDIDFSRTEQDTSYRESLEELEKIKGKEYLHKMLQKVDEVSACAIHMNNSKKVIRALEYFHQTGEKISEHNMEQRKKESPYLSAYFVLNHDRDILYQQINERIDQMIEQGLVEEVTTLYKKKGYSRDLVSMQGLGYKEVVAFLEKECTLEDAIYTLKRDTRHFAKRQLTWFKREKDVIWMDKSEYHCQDKLVLEAMLDQLKKIGIKL